VLALAHPDAEQAAHDVVDPGLDLAVGVRATLEQEADVLAGPVGLLVEQRGQRNAGAGVDLLHPGQPRQLPERFAGHPEDGAGAV